MRTSKSTRNLVAITAGDVNGIGLEVTAKALSEIGPQRKTSFFLFRSEKQERQQRKYFDLIDRRFARLTFTDLNSALVFFRLLEDTRSSDDAFLFDLCLKSSEASWVMQATELCKNKIFSSLVNGPISKETIQRAGYPFVGHTGVFRHFYPQLDLYMGFVGSDFNVLLATDHIALKDVESTLSNNKKIKSVLKAAQIFRKTLNSNKKISVLGLNPHAGEKNIIGSFESKFLKKLDQKIFTTPKSADAAFFPTEQKKYSLYLAWYHDQGLIPFKTIHGQNSGVHVTVGLPFIRTSVDHGTAFDIYNKNIANHNSMKEAILLNLKLLNSKNFIKKSGDKI